MPTVAKDDYRVQQTRLREVAKELNPGYEVHFKPNNDPLHIEMKVVDPKTGDILYTSPDGYWRYGRIADMSREEMKRLLLEWRIPHSL